MQDIDPAGVGARNLQECLSLQLERKRNHPFHSNGTAIVDQGFDLFSKKHYSRMQDKFDVDEELLKLGLAEIEKLNPKPGAMSGVFQNTHIVPDFILTIENEKYVTINRRNTPELHVSSGYQEMLGYKTPQSKSQKEAVQFIKQKLDAQWFIVLNNITNPTTHHRSYCQSSVRILLNRR